MGSGGRVNVFDPKAEWLLLHYDARPYGTGSVLGDEGGDAEGGEGAAAGGADSNSSSLGGAEGEAAEAGRPDSCGRPTDDRATSSRPRGEAAGETQNRHEPAWRAAGAWHTARICTSSNFGRPDLPDVSWMCRR